MGELRASALANRSLSSNLHGARLSAAASSNIYIFLEENPSIDAVAFWLDDPDRLNAPIQVEGAAPWDLRGGLGAGGTDDAKPLVMSDLSPGVHSVTVQAVVGGQIHLETAYFAIDDLSAALPGKDRPNWNGETAPTGSLVFDGLGRPVQELDGNAVSKTQDDTAYWEPTSDVDFVYYWLNDPDRLGPPRSIGGFNAPHKFEYSDLAVGDHRVDVVAVDGLTMTEQVVNFRVEAELAPDDSTPGHIDVSFSPDKDSHERVKELVEVNADEHPQVYFYVHDKTGTIDTVEFYIDDPFMAGTPASIEFTAPFDLMGSTTGTPNPFDLTSLDEGDHSITVLMIENDGTETIVNGTFVVVLDD